MARIIPVELQGRCSRFHGDLRDFDYDDSLDAWTQASIPILRDSLMSFS
jgi:hypothetical protein